MKEDEIKKKIFDAFFHNKKISVTRRCFGDSETCIGFIDSISKRDHPKTKKVEYCFSMVSRDKWCMTNTLASLSPWVSQVLEIKIIKTNKEK